MDVSINVPRRDFLSAHNSDLSENFNSKIICDGNFESVYANNFASIRLLTKQLSIGFERSYTIVRF